MRPHPVVENTRSALVEYPTGLTVLRTEYGVSPWLVKGWFLDDWSRMVKGRVAELGEPLNLKILAMIKNATNLRSTHGQYAPYYWRWRTLPESMRS